VVFTNRSAIFAPSAPRLTHSARSRRAGKAPSHCRPKF
jgi:hypothetical protein